MSNFRSRPSYNSISSSSASSSSRRLLSATAAALLASASGVYAAGGSPGQFQIVGNSGVSAQQVCFPFLSSSVEDTGLGASSKAREARLPLVAARARVLGDARHSNRAAALVPLPPVLRGTALAIARETRARREIWSSLAERFLYSEQRWLGPVTVCLPLPGCFFFRTEPAAGPPSTLGSRRPCRAPACCIRPVSGGHSEDRTCWVECVPILFASNIQS